MSFLRIYALMGLLANMTTALKTTEISSLGIIQSNFTTDFSEGSAEDAMQGCKASSIVNCKTCKQINGTDMCTKCKTNFHLLSTDTWNQRCLNKASSCVSGNDLVTMLRTAISECNVAGAKGTLYRKATTCQKAQALYEAAAGGVVMKNDQIEGSEEEKAYKYSGLIKILLGKVFGGIIPGKIASSKAWKEAGTVAEKSDVISKAMAKQPMPHIQALGLMVTHLKSVLATGKGMVATLGKAKVLSSAQDLGLAFPSLFTDSKLKDAMAAAAEQKVRTEVIQHLIRSE